MVKSLITKKTKSANDDRAAREATATFSIGRLPEIVLSAIGGVLAARFEARTRSNERLAGGTESALLRIIFGRISRWYAYTGAHSCVVVVSHDALLSDAVLPKLLTEEKVAEFRSLDREVARNRISTFASMWRKACESEPSFPGAVDGGSAVFDVHFGVENRNAEIRFWFDIDERIDGAPQRVFTSALDEERSLAEILRSAERGPDYRELWRIIKRGVEQGDREAARVLSEARKLSLPTHLLAGALIILLVGGVSLVASANVRAAAQRVVHAAQRAAEEVKKVFGGNEPPPRLQPRPRTQRAPSPGPTTLPLPAPAAEVSSESSGRAYAAVGGQGVEILDVRDPVRPKRLGALPLKTASRIAVRGTAVYAGMTGLGVAVADVSDPSKPRLVTTIPARPSSYITAMTVKESMLVVGDGSEIRLFDLANPLHPAETGSYRVPAGVVFGLAVHDQRVFASTYPVNGFGSGLSCVDISDPQHPRPIGELVSQRAAHNLVIEGNTAYVTLDNGVFLADVAPNSFTWLTQEQLPISPGVGAPAIRDHRLYVPLTRSGIAIVDVTRADAIHVERTIPTKSEVASVRFLGEVLAASAPDGILLLHRCTVAGTEACW